MSRRELQARARSRENNHLNPNFDLSLAITKRLCPFSDLDHSFTTLRNIVHSFNVHEKKRSVQSREGFSNQRFPSMGKTCSSRERGTIGCEPHFYELRGLNPDRSYCSAPSPVTTELVNHNCSSTSRMRPPSTV